MVYPHVPDLDLRDISHDPRFPPDRDRAKTDEILLKRNYYFKPLQAGATSEAVSIGRLPARQGGR